MKVIIKLQGCDDSTIITKDITQDQLNFLKQLRKEMEAIREYACEPELIILPKQEEEVNGT